MNMMSQKYNKGIIYAFITAIISGFSIYYSKIAVAKIPPLVLTTSRNTYVAILFIIFFLATRRLGEIKKLKKNEIFKLALIGLIGGSLPFYLFFTGLKLIGAQEGNLIHKSLFMWVTLLGYFFLKEKPNTKYILGFILVIVATYFVAPVKLTIQNGSIMVLSATLLWSIENMIAKKVLPDVSSEIVGLARMGIGSVILLAVTFATGVGNKLLTLDYGSLTIIVFGGTLLFGYVYFWYKALKYAPASLVTLILTFSVVVGTILNGAFAGVKVTTPQLESSILLTLGTILASGINPVRFFAKRETNG